jgi:4-amino-4-deoxy-L-arabinose transferase-like glycosyltransferase
VPEGGGSPRPPGRRLLRGRGHLLVLALIVVTSLTVRSAWVAYANPNPNDGRFDDTLFYDHAAQLLAAGEGYLGFSDQPTAQWPPGYPLLLAGIYKAFGHHVIAAKALNIVVGAATCILIYIIAARVFDRRVGLLAALIFALFPGQIYYTTLVSTESLSPAVLLLLLLAGLVWVRNGREVSAAQFLLFGVLFGAAMLLRGEAGILLAVVLLAGKLAVESWRRFAYQASFLLIGAVVAVAPWTVRNAITMDAFVPVATGMGHTLLAGHQDDPYDIRSAFPEIELRLKYAHLPPEEREVRVEREATQKALEFMVGHPLYELQLLPEKLYHLYEDDSDALLWVRGAWVNTEEVEWMEEATVELLEHEGGPVITISPDEQDIWSAVADGYYYVVMVFALAGIPFWLSARDKGKLLLALFVLGWTAAHLLFIPQPRYHVPIMPIFALWAAVTAVTLLRRIRAGLRGEFDTGAEEVS